MTGAVPSPGRSRSAEKRLGAVVGLALLALTAACSSSGTPPSTTSNQLVELGLSAQQTHETEVAVKDFRQATIDDPQNKLAYYDLGVIYQQQGDDTAASAEYRRALLVDLDYKPALFNLAVLETSSDSELATNLYLELLELNPKDPNVNFNLGLLLLHEGQTTLGDAHLATAIAADPALAAKLPSGVNP